MSRIAGLWHEPLGVDFSRAFVRGLRARMGAAPPEAMARTTLLVPTRRMARRVTEELRAGPACLLPRIETVSDLAPLVPDPLGRAEAGPLRLRLRLTALVRRQLESQDGLAPPSAAFDLAGSLLALLSEMQEEGVAPEALERIEAGQLSAHWQRSLAFLRIVAGVAEPAGLVTEAARQAACLDALAAAWAAAPPPGPVIVAGSTASRAPTLRLMRLVLGLPEGAVVLPGLDADMPDAPWDDLRAGDAPAGAQDHPQYRHAAALHALGRARADCPPWSGTAPAAPARNRLISLALRPAPVTDAWSVEGPDLTGVTEACAGLTLIEAPEPGMEALTIALGMREALEHGRRVALISPDRTLTRQVAAQLDRWGIEPDDSAGRPLSQSAPGRLLLMTAEMRGRAVEAEALAALLKHPVCHSSPARARHLARAREMERRLLRAGPLANPTRPAILAWAREAGAADAWAEWCADAVARLAQAPARASLAEHVAEHLDLAGRIAGGSGLGEARPGERPTGALWDGPAGRAALALMTRLAREAGELSMPLGAGDYARMLHALMSAEEVRDPFSPHPDVMIWGALEARVRSADLVILGGLNEEAWPAQPAPDPWLNRRMRAEAGLRAPERVVGLSAHDFQQAASGAEVWLTRARRGAEAETVPSRWLNRLLNLLGGLEREGPEAVADMRARGAAWLGLAEAMRAPRPRHEAPRAPRPAPRPPAAARPAQLSVTAVETLIRDPYDIYARHVLGLRALDPLRQGPDARLRGTALHEAMEVFAREVPGRLGEGAAEALRAAMAGVLEARLPWPGARAVWLGKFDRMAPAFLEAERARRAEGRPRLLERPGRMALPGLDVVLTAKADRLDEGPDGISVYDYKTGPLPGPKQQAHFAKQLALEAWMVAEGAFDEIGPRPVARAAYLRIGAAYADMPVDLGAEAMAALRAGTVDLLGRYARAETGYVARLAPEALSYASDYDHLSRFGEWGDSTPATPLRVGEAAP
jgi:double-strand break repair protein AddB